jgi:uncharacterized repeat protein (TIGR03843 family)
MPDGRRLGVDHGVTFHTDSRLRTVLWGWVGEPLLPEEVAGVRRVRTALSADLGTALRDLLSTPELEALATRCEHLLADPTFPEPEGEMPPLPYPFF